MDPKVIQEILRFVNKSDLVEVEIEEKDFKLRIKRKADEVVVHSAYAPHEPFAHHSAHDAHQHVPAAHTAHFPEATNPAPTAAPPAPKLSEIGSEKTHTILSPMVGTFYRSAGPDKDVFVRVGDYVTKGQVLCIIEAMKLFNEIESDVEGRITKILVENNRPVEYEQPLFVVEVS